MNVFISWSKDRSRHVAMAFRDWLPSVLQNVQPWMSKHDIGAGARWGNDLDVQLESTDFGILCVTPENAAEPWINYEAGALAKGVTASRVVPYLIGMERAEETPDGPLSRFQAKLALTETFDVIKAINVALGEKGLSDPVLQRVYEKWWPDLEASIAHIPAAPAALNPPSVPDMVKEILGTVRVMARTGGSDPRAEIVGSRLLDVYVRTVNADARLMQNGIYILGFTPARNGSFTVNVKTPKTIVDFGTMPTLLYQPATEAISDLTAMALRVADIVLPTLPKEISS